MSKLIHKDESYFVIGLCKDVYNELGKGFSEMVYGDALEFEFKTNGVPYNRERKYQIEYKGEILPHNYIADFVIENKIILEIKAVENFLAPM